MSEPPLNEGGGGAPEGGPDQPAGPGSADYAGAPTEPPRKGAHRATARSNPPPPPAPGTPLWPAPTDYPPDEPVRKSRGDAMAARLLWAGGALIAVIVLILLINYFMAGKTSNETPAVGTTTSKTTGAPLPKPTTTKGDGTPTEKPTTKATTKPTPKPTAKPTAAPTPKVTPKPTAKPTTKPTAKPTTAKPTAAPTTKAPVNVKAPLLVLNNSRIHGLAIIGANQFRKAGWTVTGTGNYRGRLPETTVYYSPGFKAAAETLARDFPAVTAVAPKPAGVPGSALTVILTRYFRP